MALRPSDRQAARPLVPVRDFPTDDRRPACLRVVVAEDSPATRLGLRALLAEAGFDVCGEATDAAGAVEATAREQPDACLFEIKMPGDGARAIAQIADVAPATAVVVLTSARNDAEALEAIRAGAAGYVLKDADSPTLALVIRAATRGDAVLPRSLVLQMIAEVDERERRKRAVAGLPLTSREQEVLELLRDGKTTAEIADWLFVSQVTVRTHICSILKKLEVHDREAAIRLLADLPD